MVRSKAKRKQNNRKPIQAFKKLNILNIMTFT